MTMTNKEELKLQDALTTGLFNLTGIQQALSHLVACMQRFWDD